MHNIGLRAITRKLPICSIGIVSCLLSSSLTYSLGLGRMDASSYLGQPLEAQIDIILDKEDYRASDLRVRQINEREARNLGIDLVGYNPGFRFEPVDSGRRLVIDISSRNPIHEPFLNILIELKWPKGTVYREYTLLLDPVVITPASNQTGPSQSSSRSQSSPSAQPSSRPTRVAVVAPNLEIGSESYRVRSGDSLSKIAGRVVTGTDIRRQAMMQWLLQNNPRAFVNGEMDRLLAGATLQLPANENISIADTVDQPKPTKNTAIKDTRPPPAPVVNIEERLTIVTPDAAKGSVNGNNTPEELVTALKNQVIETTETVESLRRENEVLHQRLKQLEESEYIQSLEQLVQLKEREVEVLREQMQRKSRAASDTVASTLASQDSTQSSEEQAVKPGNSGEGRQWWLILLLIASVAGAVFFLLRGRSKPQGGSTIDNREMMSDNQQMAELNKLSNAAAKNNSFAVDSRGRRADDVVKRSILEKTSDYAPPDEVPLQSDSHDEVDELISRAISSANRGAYDAAEALLVAERTQQARISTGDSGDIDARLEAALQYIGKIRPSE